MPVGNLRYRIKVGHIGIRISEGLDINHLGVWTDGSLEGLEIIDIHNCVFYALSGNRMSNEIVGASVKVVCCHDMVAVLQDVLEGIGDGRRTAGDS